MLEFALYCGIVKLNFLVEMFPQEDFLCIAIVSSRQILWPRV